MEPVGDVGSHPRTPVFFPSVASGSASPSDRAYGATMSGIVTGGQAGSRPAAPDLAVSILIPEQATADIVRDEILRSPAFGFEDEDIHYVIANPTLFYVANASAPGRPATSAEIATWARDPVTGRSVISINGDRVVALRAVKAKRTSSELESGLALIDHESSTELRPLLRTLLGPSGAARTGAATALAHLIREGNNAAAIATVLDHLEAGNASDPIVLVLRGLASAKVAQAPDGRLVGPTLRPTVQDVPRAEAAEVDATTSTSLVDRQSQAGTTDRAEAAQLFALQAELYTLTGNPDAAERATMVARFYQVDKQERDHATGGVIDVLPPDTRSIGARSDTMEQLEKVRDEREAVLRAAEGKEVPELPPGLEHEEAVGTPGGAAISGAELARIWFTWAAAFKRMAYMTSSLRRGQARAKTILGNPLRRTAATLGARGTRGATRTGGCALQGRARRNACPRRRGP
jgi:hypothetical protein